jgi:hypothetical protein
MMILDSIQLQLCGVQARLFELSLTKDFSSESFIKAYMNSQCAANFGLKYHKFQMVGEGYLLEEIMDECKDKLTAGDQYTEDVMFWTGYIYGYWHFLTGESS